jgi:hypothetical protein
MTSVKLDAKTPEGRDKEDTSNKPYLDKLGAMQPVPVLINNQQSSQLLAGTPNEGGHLGREGVWHNAREQSLQHEAPDHSQKVQQAIGVKYQGLDLVDVNICLHLIVRMRQWLKTPMHHSELKECD